jgi:hypothetical protein
MSINQKHFGLSDSLVNAVNEALHPNQKKLDVAEPKGKLDAADFKKLRKEENVDEDDKHFEKQSKKMQDAINLHLRKGKSYADAVKAAKVHVKEEVLDEKAVSQAQQKAAGAALATQRGEYAGGKKGGAVNRMALMKAGELRKIAATKRKGLPVRKEEAEQVDELSKNTLYSYGHKADKQIVRTNVMGVAKRTGGVGMKRGALKLKNRIAGSELAFKKAQKAQEEVEVTEADDAVSKQIAAKKDAMKKQIQQKIAQKQMSTMQAKANKRLSSINASNDIDKEEMKKGGKEKIEINPAMRD